LQEPGPRSVGTALTDPGDRTCPASLRESYRQLANSAITGCQKEDLRGIGVAAATSVLGDAAGTGAAWVRAEMNTDALHYGVLISQYDNLSKFISVNVSDILFMPYSGAVGGRF
jgi:hypothetical protein